MHRISIPPRIVTLLKIAALVAVLALTPWQATLFRLDYFLVVDRFLPAAAFLLLTAACVAGLVLVPFVRSDIVRIPLVVLVVAGFAADRALTALGQDLDETLIATLWREQAMIGDAAALYLSPVLRATWWSVPVALVLAWRPAPPAVVRTAWAVVPATALAGLTVVAQLTLSGTTGFPAAFRVPALTIVTALADRYSGPRDPIEGASVQSPHYGKIVMIVDESIRGDYLGINEPAQKTTPFLAGLGNLINFGVAVAAHNCSAPSRLILRSGLQAADLPDLHERAFRAPVIWQFARDAGYRTVLVDAFAGVFGTHSFMNKQERESIDESIPVVTIPIYLRDQTIAAEILPALLAGKDRAFIYVNKFGSHFPYHQTLPPGFPDGAAEIRDDLENRAELLESYQRAVRWSVDEFFRTLLQRADLSDTLIVYTSDHGQSLLEGGYKLSHCSSSGKIHPGEGNVPMLTLSDDRDFGRALKTTARERFGRTTHFDIFPTLLLAMGYPEAWVAQRYGGSSLARAGGTEAKRRFLAGDMFGRGLGARWIDGD